MTTTPRTAPHADLLDEIRERLSRTRPVVAGTMFRSPALRVNDDAFAFLGRGGRLIVKLPAHRIADLAADGAVRNVTMGRRTMREWAEVLDGPDIDHWLPRCTEALDFVAAPHTATGPVR
ncbi:hypothetical protein GCM10009624_14740 [Gordonia sinesedis]